MNDTLTGEKQMICEEIWDLTRSALRKKYPFFTPILMHFSFQADEKAGGVGTDGKVIYYDPDFLMDCYREAAEKAEHLFLHMLYHCLFLHIIMEEREDKEQWHLECEKMVDRLMDGIIVRDNHRYWKCADQPALLEIAEKQWNQIQKHTGGVGTGAISQGIGSQAGNKKDSMRLKKPGTYDFHSYLRKFAVTGEELETDTESFDYIPYLYGLEHYGNMPLIEHLEHREVHKLEELVIAIDTSGSCDLETVRRFMEETYGILSNHENFFKKMNVYILQCDFQVQHVARITSEDAWKKYMEDLTIHGRSGTDFRPVFQYVEELRRKEKLKNLKGLLYFTDGDGIYPEKVTDYRTAFVFYHEKSQHQKVPDWALQLTLEDSV